MATKAERLGLLGTVGSFLLTGVVYGFARWSGGAAALVCSVFLALSTLLAALSYFHLRLVRRKADEDLEAAELRDRREEAAAESIFTAPTEENLEAFTAEHALRQFERFIVPGFTIAFSLCHLVLALLVMRQIGGLAGYAAKQAPALFALLASVAFVLFVAGKIQAAIAEEKDYRLLLATAGYSLLCVAVSLLSAAGAAATHFKPERGAQFDTITAWVGAVVLVLLGIEYLFTALLEIYRPRIGGEARPLYESRLCELLARPRSLFASIAQAVDYQFGFQVSETWFYQLMERAVIPLIAVQVVSLYLLSCFAFVAPEELGIRERFGKPAVTPLDSGVHLKFPWPIDRVRKFPAKQALRVQIGHAGKEEEEHDHDPLGERVELWTRAHPGASQWLTASHELGAKPQTSDDDSPPAEPAAPGVTAAKAPPTAPAEAAHSVPVNIVVLHAVVQYHISDVYRFACGFADAGAVLENLAHRVTVKRLVSTDLFDLMGEQRLALAEELRADLAAAADSVEGGKGLGVVIDFFGLENVHPPVEVAGAFEGVLGAAEQAKTARFEAEAYASAALPLAEAQKAATLGEAEAYRVEKEALAKGEAAAFAGHLKAYRAGGKVYRYRAYLKCLERGLAGLRKYVITTRNTHDVTTLDLEDKFRPDLIDLGSSEEQ